MTRAEIGFRLVFSGLLMAVSAAYTVAALGFHELARYTPVAVGATATALLGASVVREWVRLRRYDPAKAAAYGRSVEYVEDSGEEGVTISRLVSALRYSLWIIGLLVAIWLVGLMAAGPLFVAAFLRLDAGTSWRFTVISFVGVLGFLLLFQEVVGFVWPAGLLNIL